MVSKCEQPRHEKLTLCKLPDEILYLIVGLLNQKLKVVLLLVNNQLNSIVVKLLYHSIYCDLVPFLINTEVCTPFNCKYTIVFIYENFCKLLEQREELLRNIKEVVFWKYPSAPGYIKGLKKNYPWIRFSSETISDMDSSDFISNIPRSPLFSVTPKENYTITTLILYLNSEDIINLDFSILPYLKSLDCVKIEEISDRNLTALISKFNQPLSIKKLSLNFDEVNNITLEPLADLCKLVEITTLEIKQYHRSTIPLNQLNWLFESLTNVKHLSVRGLLKTINSVLDIVKKNQLSTLVVGPYISLSTRTIRRIISKQCQSIERLSIDRSFLYSISFQDFERLREPSREDEGFRERYEEALKKSLGKSIKKYPKLHHVILFECHYEVLRSNKSYHIKPMNY